jgi:hypothetical protein
VCVVFILSTTGNNGRASASKRDPADYVAHKLLHGGDNRSRVHMFSVMNKAVAARPKDFFVVSCTGLNEFFFKSKVTLFLL